MLTSAQLDQIEQRLDEFFSAVNEAGNSVALGIPERALIASSLRLRLRGARYDIALLLRDARARWTDEPVLPADD